MQEIQYYIFENLNHAISFDDKGMKLIYNGFEDRYDDFNQIIFSQLKALNPEISIFKSSSQNKLRLAVNSAYEKQNLLSMMLEIMDVTFSVEYRSELATLAEDVILQSTDHLIFVENRLFSTILSEKFSAKDALTTIPPECFFVRSSLEKLEKRKRLIQYLTSLLRLHTILSPNLWEEAYALITNKGLFYRWIVALEGRSKILFLKISRLVQNELLKLAIQFDQATIDKIINDLRKNYKIILANEIEPKGYEIDMQYNIEENDLSNLEIHLIDSVNHFKKSGSHDIILGLLNDNIITHTNSIKIKELRAISEYRNRDLSTVKRSLKQLGTKSIVSRHLHGLVAYRDGNYKDALKIFQSLDNDYGAMTSIFSFNIGSCMNMIGDHSSALAYFTKVLSDFHDDYDILLNIGNVYLHLDLYENAIRYYEEAMAINPDDYRAKAYRTNALFLLGKHSYSKHYRGGDFDSDRV